MAQGREEEGKEGESIVTRRDGTHVTLTQPGQRPFRRRLTLLSTQRRKPVQGLDAGSLKQQGMERGSQIALVGCSGSSPPWFRPNQPHRIQFSGHPILRFARTTHPFCGRWVFRAD